jgi:hypothetical protein
MGMKLRDIARLVGWISLICVCLCFSGVKVLASDFEMQTFPVPISVEGKRVRSNLLLKFETKFYNMSLTEFSAKSLTAREAAFAQLMTGFKDDNYKQVRQILTATGGQEGALSNSDAAGLVKSYRDAFGNFENLKIVAQVLLGGRSLFIWEGRTPAGPKRRAFAIEKKAGALIGKAVTSSALPLDTLIVNIMQSALEEPGTYASSASSKRRFEYPIPLGAAVTFDEQHPVYLLLDGEFLNFEVFNPPPAALNPVLSFYQRAYLDFKARLIPSYLDKFTSGSRNKLQTWFAKMPPDVFEQYYVATVRGRRVKFMLNADPVFILFYSEGREKSAMDESRSYEYIVREQGSGDLKITNAYYESYLDDVLKNSKLFDLSVLQRLAKNE